MDLSTINISNLHNILDIIIHTLIFLRKKTPIYKETSLAPFLKGENSTIKSEDSYNTFWEKIKIKDKMYLLKFKYLSLK